MRIILKKFQDKFLFSDKKFIFLKSGWATGKSLLLCIKALQLAKQYPNNFILIARKEFTDLKDSTIKDWVTYTGMTPVGFREVKFANGSTIIFRHLEELHGANLQNMNLGAFFIEQAEELETDEVFFTLFGRLRRQDSSRQGFIVANARGNNWIANLGRIGINDPTTKENLLEYITATSEENKDIIPEDTWQTWQLLKTSKPKTYERFVNNNDIDSIEGALWDQELINNNRLTTAPDMKRIIVGVDPAGSSKDSASETGVVVAGIDVNDKGYVLADKSCTATPAKWGQVVVDAYNTWKADEVVAENNFGGEMVENTIKSIDRRINYKAVHASRGKIVRAEPISSLYERKLISHVGTFEKLEKQMTTYVPGEKSPDRMDASVWAFTELMVKQVPMLVPGVRI